MKLLKISLILAASFQVGCSMVPETSEQVSGESFSITLPKNTDFSAGDINGINFFNDVMDAPTTASLTDMLSTGQKYQKLSFSPSDDKTTLDAKLCNVELMPSTKSEYQSKYLIFSSMLKRSL